jgi:hypothetical protein
MIISFPMMPQDVGCWMCTKFDRQAMQITACPVVRCTSTSQYRQPIMNPENPKRPEEAFSAHDSLNKLNNKRFNIILVASAGGKERASIEIAVC